MRALGTLDSVPGSDWGGTCPGVGRPSAWSLEFFSESSESFSLAPSVGVQELWTELYLTVCLEREFFYLLHFLLVYIERFVLLK